MGKMGKVNCSNLQKFYDEVDANLSAETVGALQEECVKEIAGKLYSLVVPATPVGKMVYDREGRKIHSGGTLRKGWTIKRNAPNGKIRSADVLNNVEYASYVENGHRIVKTTPSGTKITVGYVNGQFFLHKATQRVATLAPKIVENKVKKYLNNGGIK